MTSFLLDISMKINLHVWFYFIVFLTILYITWWTGHMESSVLLSLSASCCFCYSLFLIITKMTAVYGSHFLQKIRTFFFFIELNIFIFNSDLQTKKDTPGNLNTGPASVTEPPHTHKPTQTPRPGRMPTTVVWLLPWICQREDKACSNNLLAELIQSDVSGY